MAIKDVIRSSGCGMAVRVPVPLEQPAVIGGETHPRPRQWIDCRDAKSPCLKLPQLSNATRASWDLARVALSDAGGGLVLAMDVVPPHRSLKDSNSAVSPEKEAIVQ